MKPITAIRKLCRPFLDASNLIALIALFISLATAYKSLVPSIGVEAIRTSQFFSDDQNQGGAVEIFHTVHNSGNESFAIFGVYQYQQSYVSFVEGGSNCATNLMDGAGGAGQFLPTSNPEEHRGFGPRPEIVSPGATATVGGRYNLADEASTNSSSGDPISWVVCSTAQIWLPNYGMIFLEHPTPVFIWTGGGGEGRSFSSHRLGLFDYLRRRIGAIQP
ncbi:hypothetical protein [Rhodovulum sulfidophilum]|uniref:hypothetical protein n=1 Tax=Rhodovulum sulfidophilum TaxID=35806 RepID=UPI00117A3798|nr:hypothetical protein [Rhodovulum sulfidophilum]MBL3554188.1 hypothetical protein [Rhodovulum sulfidophilum]